MNQTELESTKKEGVGCAKDSEFIVDTHNFENAKERIKKLSEDIPAKEKFDTFTTKDSFILKCFERDHHVTGEELNEFVKKIQRSLSKLYAWNIKNTNSFCEVYEALESLDKEYIAGILTAVQGAKHASEEAKTAQEDLSKTVDRLILTIEALKNFRGEINSYSHLPEIDDIFSAVEQLKVDMEQVMDALSEFSAFKTGLEARAEEINVDGTLSYPLLLTTLGNIAEEQTKIRDELLKTNDALQSENKALRKKIKISIIIGCLSISIAIANMMMCVTEVI